MLRHDELAAMASVRAAVDALCITAGEQPLERWRAHLRGTASRRDVPGMRRVSALGVTTPGRAPTLHFKDLGAPDYGGLKVQSYLTARSAVSVVSCVGCYWGRCTFCSYGNRSLEHGAYQQVFSWQLADAICETVRSTGIRFVTIADENTNLRLLVKAMRLVRRRGLNVHFNAESKQHRRPHRRHRRHTLRLRGQTSRGAAPTPLDPLRAESAEPGWHVPPGGRSDPGEGVHAAEAACVASGQAWWSIDCQYRAGQVAARATLATDLGVVVDEQSH